jgi:cytochrome c biogenesis protein CcdA
MYAFVLGLMSVLLLNVTTFLTAFAIVREKEKGTLEQLFVTPVKPLGLMFVKILPYHEASTRPATRPNRSPATESNRLALSGSFPHW